MESLYFNDYYSQKYRSTDNQLKLSGFKYGVNMNRSTSLSFIFEDNTKKIFNKYTSNSLELLILIEILNGSKLWVINVSETNGRVGVKIDINPMYITDFMGKSLAYKAFFDQIYNNAPTYNGYGAHPDISNKSFVSYMSPITQPSDFKVNLFDYQKKAIAKMIAMEKGEYNMIIDYTFNFHLKLDNNVIDSEEEIEITDDVLIKYDPFKNKIDSCLDCKLKIKSKGGILCDEMGLGKTITSLSLVAMNPSPLYLEMYKNGLIYSNATLVICPSHLAKQWESEVKRVFPKCKIIKLLTKTNHCKLSYKDVMDADIIIVTQQFLMNFKYYPQVHYQYCTPSNFSFDSRINHLNGILQGWRTNNIDIKKELQPNLEHFYFHRLIVDEGHEIFGLSVGNHSMAQYMSQWLSKISSNYKWFVSGTPFINSKGLTNSLEFIGVEIYNEKTLDKYDFNNPVISKKYLMDNVLSKVLIRHRKQDVQNQIMIPGYEEDVIWIKLTDLERNLYNAKKKNYVSDIVLQQLCCHILVSDTTNKYFGNTEVDLEVMQEKLITYHTDTVSKYTHKINTLDPTNQAYAMLKKTFSGKISESKYMLSILEKLSKKDEIDLEQNCSICFDTLSNPSLTPCGHVFCKECLELCLKVKNRCPMCKADLTGKEIYLVDNKKEVKEEVEMMNPLIKKYGSKLGKLILIVRKITADENNRIIIFSQWDRMLNLIGKTLSDNGVANSFVKGNVWARNSAINKFKMGKDSSGQDNKVIMLSLSNSASGTNLTEASHIIFVEPINTSYDEMKAIESQAIGRACRLGQNNKIKVIRILTQETIEQEIYDKIYAKNTDEIKRTIKIDDGTLENEVVV